VRFDGKLQKWNDDRGFGFITPLHGGEAVFVHISAFPPDGQRPKVGDQLTFEVEPADNGKKRAVNISRPGVRPAAGKLERRERSTGRGPGRALPARAIASFLFTAALAWFAYDRYTGYVRGRSHVHAVPAAQGASPASAARFRCDGRTMCSQMTSCEEATFFLRNCPNTQMDGDGDGIPCERQWCTGR